MCNLVMDSGSTHSNKKKINILEIKLFFTFFSDQVYADPYGYGDDAATNDESFLETFGSGIERTISDMSTYFWSTVDDAMNTIQGFIGKNCALKI